MKSSVHVLALVLATHCAHADQIYATYVAETVVDYDGTALSSDLRTDLVNAKVGAMPQWYTYYRYGTGKFNELWCTPDEPAQPCTARLAELARKYPPDLPSTTAGTFFACNRSLLNGLVACTTTAVVYRRPQAACSLDAPNGQVDLGQFEMKTGKHVRSASASVTLQCNTPVHAEVTATTSSDGFDVRVPPGPGETKDGHYDIAIAGRHYAVESQYTLDTNVRVAGPKTHSVVYTVSIE